MPKLPRLTAMEIEAILLKAGFDFVRGKGSHRIYMRGSRRIVVPFHPGKVLHPKVIRQVLKAIDEFHDNRSDNTYKTN